MSETVTPTVSETVTPTVTETVTPTSINSPVDTVTVTQTITETATPSVTQTATETITLTVSETVTSTTTQTATVTPTSTDTPEDTVTPTETVTETVTSTITGTITTTVTSTVTQTITPTVTSSVTQTITESWTPTPTNTEVFETPTFTPTRTPVTQGVGSAVISPLQAAAGTGGNTMTISFTNGPDAWGSGVLRVVIPDGWSAPSLTGSVAGYYTVAVSNGTYGGTIRSGQTITVYVSGLQANTGTVTIVYGSKISGGPGAIAQAGAGTAVFRVENNPAGTTSYEIASSPYVDVVIPTSTPTSTSTYTVTPTITNTYTNTATVTHTPTPVTGEGSALILPASVMAGGTGNTLVITYTAGMSAWAVSPAYGMLRITVPSGWSVPSISGAAAGYFTASVSSGSVAGTSVSGMDMRIFVSGLVPGGTITVTYGSKTSGGPGAAVQAATGEAVFITASDYTGTNPNYIISQPSILVADATATVTQTATPTYTATPDSTPGQVVSLQISQSGNSMTLSWNTDALADYYRFYISEGSTGRLQPFPAGWNAVATVLPTPGVTSFTYSDALNRKYLHYAVAGVNAAGTGSSSVIASKVRFDFIHSAVRSNVYRLSLPYINKYTKASDIVNEIEGNTYSALKINQLLLWNPENQSSRAYSFSESFGRWLGNDWSVDAGTSSSNAIYIGIVSDFDWVVAGIDKNSALEFKYNAFVSGLSNSNKRSMPYSSAYEKASDIVVEIEGGTGAGTNTKIDRLMTWNPETQSYSTYSYSSSFSRWIGNNFEIVPGSDLNIYVTQNFTWTPKIVVTPVP